MKLRERLTYIICFVFIVILSFARIKDFTPLSIGLSVALVSVGLNAIAVSAFSVAAACIKFTVPSVVYSSAAAVVCIAFWLITKKKKTDKRIYIIMAAVSQIGLIVYAVIVRLSVITVTINVFLSIVFSFLCYIFAVPCIVKRFNYKFMDSSLAAGGIIIASLAYGLTGITFPLSSFFFSLTTLTSVYLFGLSGVAASLCFALGYCAGSGTEMFGAFALMALCAYVFIPTKRVICACSLPLACLLYTSFFSVMPPSPLWWMISLAVGGAVFVLLPKKGLKRLKDFFRPDGRKTLRVLVDRSRYDTGRRLRAVSDVFNEMSVMMSGEKQTLSDSHLNELTDVLIGETCALCRRYDACLSSGVMGRLKQVMSSSMEKGSATIANIPDEIKSNCINLAQIVSCAGEIAQSYSDQIAERKSVDYAKQIVAVQMQGISDILCAMSLKESEPLLKDDEIEKNIVEELTYRLVVTSEALISADMSSVMLTVATETFDAETVKSALKKILKKDYTIEKTENSATPMQSVVFLKAKPLFDVVFSAAASALKDVSGDTHSFIKINDHTFMMALCDGMGNGQKAAEFSSSVISLIENFYKAGFSHKIALKSVNDFLSVSGEEIYATVDIAVVNLISGECDVIKIGSPPSYVKTKDTVLRIEGQALPIGVLQEMRPSAISYTFEGGETLVFASDGIPCGDALIDVINESEKYPQPLCRKVVDFSVKQKKEDDCTAVAFHIFKSA